ncbi:MAG: cytochrome c-type biogenesis protein CcmE [Cryomorphaceae bacterium]|jgi:cytochrome c-type biogenesis protein CcmE
MSPTQKKRFTIVTLVLIGMGIATALGLMAVKSSIEYFRTPSQIHNGEFNVEQTFKIAGLVKKGSLLRMEDGVTQRFTITDCEQDVVVQYTGILPDLFREGQAIVTVGKFTSEPLLIAQQVLAKHDENYVPNEAADALMLAQANKCDTTDGPVKY